VTSAIDDRPVDRLPGIDYTVRESRRAKHVRLKVSASDGLVVVVPAGFDRRRIPALIDAKRGWIERSLQQVEARRAAMPSPDRRPDTIELRAMARTWRVEWVDRMGPRITVDGIGSDVLRIVGPIGDPETWRPALRRWLIEQGREHLIPWAERLADGLGVTVRGTSVRCQTTRWGSYSTRSGTVSLNAQLLFLPERLARFVLVHELCHVRHPDHSPAFWDLVRVHEPDTETLRAELRTAWRYVPVWVSGRHRDAV